MLEEWCLAHALLEGQRRDATRVRAADEEGGAGADEEQGEGGGDEEGEGGADEPLLLTLALALPGALVPELR